VVDRITMSVTYHQDGDLAQMVERMLSMHEAQGSIPWFSTLLTGRAAPRTGSWTICFAFFWRAATRTTPWGKELVF
jgi:hypothetical protein